MTEHTHITTPESLTEDSASEPTLRPRQLEEFIGQGKVKEALSISIEAARQRREPLDHILFHGPPGLGKTTMAALLAREMGVNIKTTSGPILEKPADLVGILTNQREGDILFIDEIHRLRPVIEEFLYPAMEPLRRAKSSNDDDEGGTLHPSRSHYSFRIIDCSNACPLWYRASTEFLSA